MIPKIKKVGADILFHAINHHNLHDAIALLEDGEVDVDGQNINGMTALHYAVEAQSLIMIKTLLMSYKADANIHENEEIGKNTPIHRAVDKNMLDAVDLFLQCGGDPSLKNS